MEKKLTGEKTIKNLMLEDMLTDTNHNNRATTTTRRQKTSDCEPVKRFVNKSRKASKANLQLSSPETSNSSSIAGLMETIREQIHRTNGEFREEGPRSTLYANRRQLDEINLRLVQRSAKEFIDRIFIDRKCNSKDGVSSNSKPFSDPLDILISNRSLFLQSLQYALRDSETIDLFPSAKFSECEMRSTDESEMLDYSVRNNEQIEENVYSSSRSSTSQPSNKIVVLRPAPKVVESPMHVTCSCSSLQSHQRPKSKEPNVKFEYFSFKEIKRRLKRALGDNQEKPQWISILGSFYKFSTKKQITIGTSDQELRTDLGSDIKSRIKIDEKRDLKSRNGSEISSTGEPTRRKLKLSRRSYSGDHESEIFQEAKKHLSERLRNVSKSKILEDTEAPRTLRKILCSPEHESFSPVNSNSVTNSTALNKLSVNDDHSFDGDSKILETNDSKKREDLSTFNACSESINSDSTSARHSPDTRKLHEEYNSNSSIIASNVQSIHQASPPHDRIVKSSSSRLGLCSPEELNSSRNGEEHQSPVSVLEPFCIEDGSSPESITTQQAKGSLRPLKIDFELVRDPTFDTSASINEDESISAYVKAVLQASSLKDEPLLTRPSPKRVLVEKLFSTELHDDPALLFDCVNEVLTETYEQHFGCSPFTSYLKPNTRSFHISKNQLVDETVKGVKCLLNPELAEPTLDELIGQDFARSTSWLDIRIDTEDLVNEIAEGFLQESIVDTILMLHHT